MRDGIIIACFTVVMALNIIALTRHWFMMRLLRATLNGLIESQRQFTELMDAESARRYKAPLQPDGD